MDGLDVVFRDFRVLTMSPAGLPYGQRDNAWIGVREGRIVAMGEGDPTVDASAARVVRGSGRFLSPGLIDCHTHLVYAGNRSNEWEQRMCGASYDEIARSGGGILSTVKATRAASEQELVDSGTARLRNLLQQGVTTVEVKSGYGLDWESERKMLRAARRLSEALPVRVVTTFLGAHAVPPEVAGNPSGADQYVDQVCDQMIPSLDGLADAVDVFCESIAFSLSQTRRIFDAAIDAGLPFKVHAEQLSHSGSAALAAELGALSADHLEYLTPEDAQAMGRHGTVATLLPGAFYSLRETQRPPVDALREAGCSIAIATDANPGSSPVSAVLLAANMACTLFHLTPEEAIVGLTRHAAGALGLADEVGTIEVGRAADLAVWDIETPAELAYGIGHNPCVEVYRDGELVFRRKE